MRGMFGMFFGANKRNQPVKLTDKHPVEDYGTHSIESGDAGKDGFTILSRASPDHQGNPPPVAGTEGPCYWGQSQDFEQ